MPFRFSDLSGVVSPIEMPRYRGGAGRLADSVAGFGEQIQRGRQLGLQEQELAQRELEAAQRHQLGLARHDLALGQQDISRGFLDVRHQELATREEELRRQAMAEFTDALTSPVQDPAKVELAKARLAQMGITAEGPQGAAPAPAMGPVPAAPPEGSPEMAGQMRQPQPPPGQAPTDLSSPLGGVPAVPPVPPKPPTPAIAAWRLKQGDDVLMEIDPATGNAARMKLVADAFAPLVASARSEEERRAAGLAMSTAEQLMQTGVPTKEAIDTARKSYEFEMSQANSMKRAQIGAHGRAAAAQAQFGSSGMGKQDYEIRSDITAHMDKVVTQVAGQRRVSAINDTDTEFAKLASLIDENSGFADSNAVVSFITAMQQRVSNADYQVAIGAGGVMSQLQNFVNRYDPRKGGKMDAAYMRQVRSAAMALRRTMAKEKLQIARQAEQMARARAEVLRLSPEDTELLVRGVRTPFLPEGIEEPMAPRPAAGKPAQKTPPTPPAGGTPSGSKASINERLRRLGI